MIPQSLRRNKNYDMKSDAWQHFIETAANFVDLRGT
jgi:hypothetical protein